MSGDVPELTHADIEELLGAYALDAVDRPTAAVIEAHLDQCVRCSAEVAQHHEVAGLLANSGGASPAGLWDGIAGRLDEVSPPSWDGLAGKLVVGEDRTDRVRDGDGAEQPRRPHQPDPGATVVPLASKRRGRLAAAAIAVAAVAAALALVLGLQVHHLDNRVSALQARSTLTGAEQAALADPSTQKVTLAPGAGIVVGGERQGHRGAHLDGDRFRGGSRVVGAALEPDLPAVGDVRRSGHIPRSVGP